MTARYFNRNQQRDPTEFWSPETARQARTILTAARYRHLRRQAGPEGSTIFSCMELIDSGQLEGWVTLGADGTPLKITDVRITALGREYLEMFEDEIPCSPPLFQRQVFWLAKGCAVAALLVGLIALVPETDMHASKPKDLITNSVPVPHIPVLPFAREAAIASVHAEKTFELHATTDEGPEFFSVLSTPVNPIE